MATAPDMSAELIIDVLLVSHGPLSSLSLKSLSLLRKHGFSTAIFAPGWVYECHDKAEFRSNQDK